MSNSSSDYENLSKQEKEIYGTPPEESMTLAKKLSEKKFKKWVKNPEINMDPKTWQLIHGRKSPTIEDIKAKAGKPYVPVKFQVQQSNPRPNYDRPPLKAAS